MIAELFDKSRSTITEHLQNIFKEGELDENSVCREFRHTGADGKEYNVKFYNLDAIISVGYRVNSLRATQFRQWATGVLRTFAIRGYVLDKERLKNGTFLNEGYFEHLLEEIREIRASERRFYQKITDIYITAIDYNPHTKLTKDFFKTIQNKLHYAKSLDRFVTMYLDYAESQAERNIPMTMEDWAKKLNAFLQFNEKDILENAGKVTAAIAKEFA